jgi:hypothetical protein
VQPGMWLAPFQSGMTGETTETNRENNQP